MPVQSRGFTACPAADSQSKGSVDVKTEIENLYQNISGFSIGDGESDMISQKGGNSTYGEITPQSLETLHSHLKLGPADKLIDLGCGVGKVCVQTVLGTDSSAVGVELSPTRYKNAVSVKEELVKSKRLKNPERLQFLEKNISEVDLSDATVVFMCSTCFSDELMQTLVDNISKSDKPVRVVTLKRLPEHKDFVLVQTLDLPMTWSSSTPVHLYRLEKKKSVKA